MRLKTAFKSELEEKVAAQLERAGVKFGYETRKLEFLVPERKARYKPDFPIEDSPIILEAKGRFGHRGNKKDAAEVRQRLILAKQQNPDVDIRLVFQNAQYKIYPGSATTYGQWATDHNFLWSDKGIIPKEWLDDMSKAQRKKDSGATSTKRKTGAGNGRVA